MTFFNTGRTTIRRASLALVLALIAAAPLAQGAGSAHAAGTSKLYAATVHLGGSSTVVAQLQPGDVVVGTVNIEMDPAPETAWFWFATVSAPGFSKTINSLGGQFQMQFTATAAGPLKVGSIGTGTAYLLFTVTPRFSPVPVTVGGVTRR